MPVSTGDKRPQAPRDPDQPFRMMDLPAELRTIVYEIVLTYHGSSSYFGYGTQVDKGLILANQDVNSGGGPYGRISKTERPGKKLAILRSNRQIYQESKNVFYYCNDFHFNSAETFLRFASKIKTEFFMHLGSVHLLIEETPLLSEDETFELQKGWVAVAGLLSSLKTTAIVDLNIQFQVGHALPALGPSETLLSTIPQLSIVTEVASKVTTLSVGGNCPEFNVYVINEAQAVKDARDFSNAIEIE